MEYVYGGSTIQMEIASVTTLTQSPDAVVQNASGLLQEQGFQVTGYTINTASAGTSIIASIGLVSNQPFTVTMSVLTPEGTDYADDTDVTSIVNNAFYQTTGYLPSASVNLQMTDEDGKVTQLGSPFSSQTPGNQESGADNPVSSLISGIEAQFQGLTSTTMTLIWVVLGIIVLAMILIAFGPNVGSVAKAFA